MAEYITKGQAWGVAMYVANIGDLENAKKLLDVIPPANFTPAVQGRWIESDHGSYICSLCYEDWMLNDGTPEENHMNYCPRCGARMGDALDGR